MGTRKGYTAALWASALALAISHLCVAGVTLRVWDNGSVSDDDIARVWLDGTSLGLIDQNPGGTNERTWDLGVPALGTHVLVIEHVADLDAADLCDEKVGTYGIEFGGGGLAASDDSATVHRGLSIEIDVLANDVYVQAASSATDVIPCPSEDPQPTPGCACSDPRTTYETSFEVSGGSVTISRIVSPPVQGTAEILPGGQAIRYTPNPDACGSDTLRYEAGGPGGSSDTARVTVSILSSPPVAADDYADTSDDQPILVDVLQNDADAGGGALTILSVGAPTYGTAVVAGDAIRYTPRLRHEGVDRFAYTVRDPCGATASAAVEVRIVRANHPPTAHAGAVYVGVVGEPVTLDASVSSDPDIGDTLQYRWDLNGDSRFDTEWLSTPQHTVIFDRPYVGTIRVEVRDLSRGQPTGTTATATALVRIGSRQTIRVHVFEDLDGDGSWRDGEPSLAGIEVEIGERTMRTDPDGSAAVELDPGTWEVSLTAGAIAELEGRGFAVSTPGGSVVLSANEHIQVEIAVLKTSGRLRGIVYVDQNGDGEFDDADRPIQGLYVVLDGDEETAQKTDAAGRFTFFNVAFGSHALLVFEPKEEGVQPPSLLVPTALARTGRNELFIPWPFDLGPEEGFLRVEVKRGQGD